MYNFTNTHTRARAPVSTHYIDIHKCIYIYTNTIYRAFRRSPRAHDNHVYFWRRVVRCLKCVLKYVTAVDDYTIVTLLSGRHVHTCCPRLTN